MLNSGMPTQQSPLSMYKAFTPRSSSKKPLLPQNVPQLQGSKPGQPAHDSGHWSLGNRPTGWTHIEVCIGLPVSDLPELLAIPLAPPHNLNIMVNVSRHGGRIMPDAAAVVVDEVCAGTSGMSWRASRRCTYSPSRDPDLWQLHRYTCIVHRGTRPAVTWHRFSCCICQKPVPSGVATLQAMGPLSNISCIMACTPKPV